MDINELLHDQIIEIVMNQVEQNDPPETKQTLQRLISEGISEKDANKYIGQCVAVELFNIMKNGEAFNEKRYVQNLKNLPAEPFE